MRCAKPPARHAIAHRAAKAQETGPLAHLRRAYARLRIYRRRQHRHRSLPAAQLRTRRRRNLQYAVLASFRPLVVLRASAPPVGRRLALCQITRPLSQAARLAVHPPDGPCHAPGTPRFRQKFQFSRLPKFFGASSDIHTPPCCVEGSLLIVISELIAFVSFNTA
jgi:hypothetical protein